ncbi:hypothetical protein OG892_22090 [Streptomyces sp. NBC_00341]|uniref:hypothetical protein n=1 Tax=Streptomyces sp. NBC_00341 TaxID=2975717 RepID=UPI003089B539|nr:hypothetical protein OG892_22090 [Streptomyces sp. NBC_00341]
MNAEEQARHDEFERQQKIRAAAYDGMITLVGQAAQASALVELHLRQLMVALLDSRYAKLVAAGLSAGDLIDTCTVLLKVNKEINGDQRTEGLALLSGLKDLLNTRNNLVHGLIAIAGDGDARTAEAAPEPVIETMALVSKRRKPEALLTITKAEVEKTIKDLRERGDGILHWVVAALPSQLHRDQVTG